MKRLTKGIIATLICMLVLPSYGLQASEKKIVNDKECEIIVGKENYIPNKTFKIDFNEPVDLESINENSVYIKDQYGNLVSGYMVKSLSDTSIEVIPNNVLEEGKAYTLYVGEGVKSKEGKGLNPLSKFTFSIGNYSDGIFKIIGSRLISKDTIDIYFSHPIDDSAMIERNYQITSSSGAVVNGSYKTIAVERLTGADNAVRIKLKDSIFYEENYYSLYVYPDLISAYGSRLNNGEGDFIPVEGTVKENSKISVKEAKIIEWNMIELTFNDYFEESTAKDISNYSVEDDLGNRIDIKDAKVDAKNRKVILETSNNFKKDIEYELAVRNIYDIFLADKMESFNAKLTLVTSQFKNLDFAIKPLDKKTLELQFNQEIDILQGRELNNYYVSLEGKATHNNPHKIYINEEDSSKVRLFFKEDLLENQEYTLNLSSNIKGKYGYKNFKKIEKKFKSYGGVNRKLNVDKVSRIDKKKIKVNFSKEISEKKDLDIGNIELIYNEGSNRQVIIKCSGIEYVDASTIILGFDGMKDEEEYKLYIKGVKDYTETEEYVQSYGVTVGKK